MKQVEFISRRVPFLNHLAEQLWSARDTTTGLAGHLVILPSLRGVRQLRYHLRDRLKKAGEKGMLLPGGLNLWQLLGKIPLPRHTQPLGEEERILRLAQWLETQQEREFRFLDLHEVQPLRLAQYVLDAVDDLIRYSELLEQEEFHLSTGDDLVSQQLLPLLDESVQEVVTLARDYLKMLHAEGLDDPVYHREVLAKQGAESPLLASFCRRYDTIWLAGFDDATDGERALLKALAGQPNVNLLVYRASPRAIQFAGKPARSSARYYQSKHPDYSSARLLHTWELAEQSGAAEDSLLVDALFPHIERDTTGKRRLHRPPDALEEMQRYLKSIAGSWVVECEDPFHESMWVARRTRQHLTASESTLIITADHAIASLIQQMLEFWGIDAESTFGEPLAQSWLYLMLRQTREIQISGEHYRSISALWRNPLMGGSGLSGQYSAHQLEREIAPHEGVATGIRKLHDATEGRESALKVHSQRAGTRLKANYAPLRRRLRQLEDALALLNDDDNRRTADRWAQACWRYLETLIGQGLLDGFNDPADARFVAVLQNLCGLEGRTELALEWAGFLELLENLVSSQKVQRARNRETPVLIADVTQARFLERDRVIFCGLTDESFPGQEPTNPLIPNDARGMLGMLSSSYWEGLRGSTFMRYFSSARRALFTYHRQHGGNPVLRSRFLERVLGAVETLGDQPQKFVDRQVFEYLWPGAVNPDNWKEQVLDEVARARVPTHRLPDVLSASQTQQYLMCPYAWYCERVLGLRPEEDVEEILTARDYGTEVHLILRAFYESEDRTDLKGIPGPFSGDVREDPKGAEALLQEISEAILEKDIFPDLATQEMFLRFESLIPFIVEAEIRRWDEGWRPGALEQTVRWSPEQIPFTFTSKIDRLDRNASGELSILDYKTGTTPSRTRAKDGLLPQLYIGALGTEQQGDTQTTTGQVAYYALKPRTAANRGIGTADLTSSAGKRNSQEWLSYLSGYKTLLTRVGQLFSGSESVDFPAIQGSACDYCPYDGICRKDEVAS